MLPDEVMAGRQTLQPFEHHRRAAPGDELRPAVAQRRHQMAVGESFVIATTSRGVLSYWARLAFLIVAYSRKK
jgi:hypothetical protein